MWFNTAKHEEGDDNESVMGFNCKLYSSSQISAFAFSIR